MEAAAQHGQQPLQQHVGVVTETESTPRRTPQTDNGTATNDLIENVFIYCVSPLATCIFLEGRE